MCIYLHHLGHPAFNDKNNGYRTNSDFLGELYGYDSTEYITSEHWLTSTVLENNLPHKMYSNSNQIIKLVKTCAAIPSEDRNKTNYVSAGYEPPDEYGLLSRQVFTINHGAHTTVLPKFEYDFRYYKPIRIEADAIEGKRFREWRKYEKKLNSSTSTRTELTDFSQDIIYRDGVLQLMPTYGSFTEKYIDIEAEEESTCEIFITNGTMLSYSESSQYPDDDAYVQARIDINSDHAVVPFNTDINVKPIEKYGEKFVHWEVTRNNSNAVETYTTNYIDVKHYNSGTTLTITGIYTTEIEYVTISLRFCRLVYCSKHYLYDSPRSVRVEKGSTIIVLLDYEAENYTDRFKYDTNTLTRTCILHNVTEDMDLRAIYDNELYIVALDDNCNVSLLDVDVNNEIPTSQLWYDPIKRRPLAALPTVWRLPKNCKVAISCFPLPKYQKLAYYEVAGSSGVKTYCNDMVVVGEDAGVRAILEPYDSSIKYTCIVYDENNDTRTYTKSVGEQLQIEAARAPEGYEFYKWGGDTKYITNIYSPTIDITMPAEHFVLRMLYKPIGHDIYSFVKLHEGKIVLEDGTLVSEGEFKEGSVLTITVAETIPEHWMFYRWGGDQDSMSVVEDVFSPNTTLLVKDFDIELTREIMEHSKWSLTITNGEISGSYYEKDSVVVYYLPPDPSSIFLQWTVTGIEELLLTDGTPFDITNPGSPDNPQVISMPAEDVSLVAEWRFPYQLTIENGVGDGTYKEGALVAVSFTAPENVTNYKFVEWTGDTDGLLLEDGSPFDVTNPNPQTIVMPAKNVNLSGTYSLLYTVSVTNGGASGTYGVGELVPIYFTPVETDAYKKVFDYWQGDYSGLKLEDGTSFNRSKAGTIDEPQMIVMPAKNISLTARCKIPRTLNITNGETSGTFYYGDSVDIYFVPPEGVEYYRFDGWAYSYGSLTLTNGEPFKYSVGTIQTISMPNTSVTLTGKYTQLYSLDVINGTGTGVYELNNTITITADPAPDGMIFDQWTGDINCLTDSTSATTTAIMPATNITITATFKPISE